MGFRTDTSITASWRRTADVSQKELCPSGKSLLKAGMNSARNFSNPVPSSYVKFANPASRYAIVGVMVAETDGGIRVAVTGAGACAFRASDFEAALTDSFTADSLDGVPVDATDLNSDLHASAEFRAHLVGVMAKRAVKALGG